jgi:hypothetical protein
VRGRNAGISQTKRAGNNFFSPAPKKGKVFVGIFCCAEFFGGHSTPKFDFRRKKMKMFVPRPKKFVAGVYLHRKGAKR